MSPLDIAASQGPPRQRVRDGRTVDDPTAWQLSPEGRNFNQRSSAAWGEAHRAAGADPEAVARPVANTTAFYAPDPGAPDAG